MTRPLVPTREGPHGLTQVVETLLDKGLVLNADIMVSVAGVELLGIRIRAALASFETAARYGLEFPAGTDTSAPGWRDAVQPRETCLGCSKRVAVSELLDRCCPWCGWQSARAKALAAERAADPPAARAEEHAPTARRSRSR